MKKKIGILAWMTGTNSFGVTSSYADFIQQNFGELIIIPANSTEIVDVDLLILPGGRDVDVLRYNEVPTLRQGQVNHLFEYFDRVMLSKYIAAGISIVGICRGMQTLNVHFGGSLYQDLPCTHDTNPANDRGKLVNKLVFTEKYKSLPDRHNYEVNSIHHQSVKELGEGLELVAFCKENNHNVVEIIKHESLPIWGFQYHPEEIWDTVSVEVIENLLNNDDEE